MLKTDTSPRGIQRAEISWKQSQADLKIAKGAIKSQPHKGSLQSAQAAINALSSVLEAHGYFQLPAFSATELLEHCIEIDSVFEELRGPCTLLDGTLERDMFGSTRTPTLDFTPSFARACFKASEQIHKQIKQYWKQHKKQFFAP